MDDTQAQRTVTELVEKTRICMVTTVDEHDHLTARPLTRQEGEFHGVLEFVVPRDGDLVAQIHRRPEVGVALQSSDGYVSLCGEASEITDRSRLQEHWGAATEAFFPDGPETATLVRVDCHHAEYWDSRGSSLAKVASFVRAAVSDDDRGPDLGESGTVRL